MATNTPIQGLGGAFGTGAFNLSNTLKKTTTTSPSKTSTKTTSSGSSSSASSKSTGSPASSSSAPQGIAYNPAWASHGVTLDIWNQMNDVQRVQASIAMTSALTSYASNASSLSVADATAAALKDPNIISKYADALKIDQAQLTAGISDLQTSISTTAQSQATQFETERKALAEQEAAAGTAYSGFRGKAQENLGQAEAGIVTSTRLQAQQKLREAQQAFESKWGTAATPTASITYVNPLTGGTTMSGQIADNQPTAAETLSGATVGGITGTQIGAKSADVEALAEQNIKLAQPVGVTSL